MLNKIIEFSVRNKLIIGLFMVVLICFGIYELRRLPIDAVPDITDNQVQVITVTPSLGAPDVERLITFPIEQVNSNIPDLKEIRSFSRFGLSVVTIVFNDKTDVYWARQQVNERLRQVQELIPKGFGTPELAPVTTGLGEIYQYTVRAKKGYEDRYDAMQLRTIQDWIVRRQLLSVKGVADVSSFGGLLKQYEIAVNSDRLKSYGTSISEVFAALQNSNQNTGGAYIEKGPTVLFIRSEGLVGNIEDIENIVVKTLSDGTPLLIRNVADVRLGHATRYGAMTYNGERQVSGAVVMMLKGANSNEVIKNIKDRVEQIQKTLPEGVIIDPFLDRTKMVNSAIGTVEKNLLEGAVIVLIVLILFLGNWRAGLLVASVIPLAMLIAVILMNIFGVSGNLMSLGALDFGLIVDGAVIIVEAIMHQLALRKAKLTKGEMDSEVVQVSARMRNAAIFGELIILIVYIPIFTLQGVEGKMFRPMAQTVAFALIGAFILSLTYIPVMSSLLLNRPSSGKKNWSERAMHWLELRYESALMKALRLPKIIVGTALLLFVLAVTALSFLGGEFIPRLEEGDYAIETRVLSGSNLQTSINAVSQGSKVLLAKFPEIIEIVGKTGSSEIPTDPMPIEATDMMVILKDKKDWTSASSFDELTEKMSKELEAVPGVTFGFQYPVQMRFNELMTGARQDVVCKIFGENLDSLAAQAKVLGAIANRIDGVRDLYIETVTGMPQIVIHYNRAALAQYGIRISEINNIVNTAFAGQATGQVYEGEKRFDLVVRLSGDQRKDLADVQHLLVTTSAGQQIPLNQVADVRIEEGPGQIQRENAERRIIVGFNVRGRDVQSIVQELQQKAGEQMKMPAGYYVTYGGTFENLNAAKKRLGIVVPVALLLIFLMLYFAFGSIRESLLIYSAIPLSAIGGVFALVLRGMPFSISAGVGFIALFGVVVLNGIVLIGEFNRIREGGETDLKSIVLLGTKTRLRPVLMTAAVASLGFLPMALSNGAGAEVQRPLATVVIGGLVTATFLTLFVLPALFIMFQKKNKRGLPGKAIAAVVLLITGLCSYSSPASAQSPISLQAAIDTALKNNLSLRSSRLNAAYQKQLRNAAWDIPQTTIGGEYGQFNSNMTDSKIGISQTIKFPVVYARQRSLADAEWKKGLANASLKEAELKKQVRETFYELTYLLQKQQLLRSIDTLFSGFLDKANARLNAGESNIMEKTTAETQRGQATRQLRAVERDLHIAMLRFQLLLNTETVFLPETAMIKATTPDTVFHVADNPALKVADEGRNIAMANERLERSRLLPDLSAGYFNQTFRGMQNTNGTNLYFTGADRFSYGSAGIGIPLFFGAQKARIRAAKIGVQQSAAEYDAALQSYQVQYAQALQQLNNSRESIDYYESTALKNADTIIETADLQFRNGEISYLEWALLVNQSITIRSEYIETVRSFNQNVIELTSLSGL